MVKVALVTGGSRGIGAATAKLLACQGYKVCINYLKQTSAALDVVSEIEQTGGVALAVQANVAEEAEVDRLFAEINARFGPVTHLVNNAGVLYTQSKFSDLSYSRFKQVLETNVLSCFLCCKAFLKQGIERGAIVNVSSVAAKTGSPFEYVDYAASKGAMDSLTKGLSLEVASQNIRVNGVRPGLIHTDIHKDGGEPERVTRLSPTIPLKRGGEPKEVADAIAWLLSDDASYITGSFLDVAGGKQP